MKSGERRRNNEQIDWRKIASIDIDKLASNGIEENEDILRQIAFCKAENEFDKDKIDPGFIKVFKLSQLILEQSLDSQEELKERLKIVEGKNRELEENKRKVLVELYELKESLSNSRKELKKRKDIIASTQSEVLGANKDEYDQCPYCSKKFLTTMYLYSHIQRRHQGLPMPVQAVFPFQNLNSIPYQAFSMPNQSQMPSYLNISSGGVGELGKEGAERKPTSSRAIEIQTDKSSPVEEGQLVDLDTIGKYLEDYLQGRNTPFMPEKVKLVLDEKLKSVSAGLSFMQNHNEEKEEKSFEHMKNELEAQWKVFADKMKQGGFDELKTTFIQEMHKMQEIISKTQEKSLMMEEDAKSKGDVGVIENNVEERFLKQENQLESLKQHLQSKMQEDMVAIEGKLDSQERYWRNKLKVVEEEYNSQIQKLREEFQASILNPSPKLIPKSREEQQKQILQNESSQTSEFLLCNKNQYSPTQFSERQMEQSNYINIEKLQVEKAEEIEKPILKPRRIILKNNENQPNNNEKIREIEDSSAYFHPPEITNVQSNMAINHEYEEPNGRISKEVISDYYSSSEECHSNGENESLLEGEELYSSDEDTFQNEPPPPSKKSPKILSNMDAIRSKVISDLNKEMAELGLKPDGTELFKEATANKNILEKLKMRRKLIEQSEGKDIIKEERKIAQKEEKLAFTDKSIKNSSEVSRLLTPSRKGNLGKSPIGKILKVVKNQGKNLKKRMASAVKRDSSKPNTPKKSPMILKKNKKSSSFFKRHSWGSAKNNNKNDRAKEELVESDFSVSEPEEESDNKVNYSSNDDKISTSTPINLKNKKSLTQVTKFHNGDDQDSEDEINSMKRRPKTGKMKPIKSSPRKSPMKSRKSPQWNNNNNSKKIPSHFLAASGGAAEESVHSNFKKSKPIRRSLLDEFNEKSPLKIKSIENDSINSSNSSIISKPFSAPPSDSEFSNQNSKLIGNPNQAKNNKIEMKKKNERNNKPAEEERYVTLKNLNRSPPPQPQVSSLVVSFPTKKVEEDKFKTQENAIKNSNEMILVENEDLKNKKKPVVSKSYAWDSDEEDDPDINEIVFDKGVSWEKKGFSHNTNSHSNLIKNQKSESNNEQKQNYKKTNFGSSNKNNETKLKRSKSPMNNSWDSFSD